MQILSIEQMMIIEIRQKEYDNRYIMKIQKSYSSFTHLLEKNGFSPSVNYKICRRWTEPPLKCPVNLLHGKVCYILLLWIFLCKFWWKSHCKTQIFKFQIFLFTQSTTSQNWRVVVKITWTFCSGQFVFHHLYLR